MLSKNVQPWLGTGYYEMERFYHFTRICIKMPTSLSFWNIICFCLDMGDFFFWKEKNAACNPICPLKFSINFISSQKTRSIVHIYLKKMNDDTWIATRFFSECKFLRINAVLNLDKVVFKCLRILSSTFENNYFL